MMQILPYLLVFVLGLFVGAVVNFLIDWLYIRRQAHAPGSAVQKPYPESIFLCRQAFTG